MSDELEPLRFRLVRYEDVNGVSGTGTVAFGTYYPFPNDRATLAWCSDTNSVAVFDSIEDIEEIHGHDGRAEIEWIDDPVEQFEEGVEL